jgi:2-amino-4-hydroxy-6-hydroxymethyldihydropteridine diphosphokinase
MSSVYLIFGSNLDNRLEFLEKAKLLVQQRAGNISKSSAVYDTEPWGFVHENTFLNQVVVIHTELSPFTLLAELKKVETLLGRINKESDRYAARTIDIDILFYDDLVINTSELAIPHLKIEKRRFVLEPLMEIAADFIHPVLKKTVEQLLKECEDHSLVSKTNLNLNQDY